MAVATVALASASASAHPAFNPSEIAGGAPVETSLIVPHGCNPGGGMPDDDAASPTVELALELAPAVTTAEPGAVDGWTTSTEIADGRRVIVWTAAGGATTEPLTLPVSLVVDAGPGTRLHLRAHQVCERGEFRWVGTPDDPAEWPAVALDVAATTAEPTDPPVGPDDVHAGRDAGTATGTATGSHDRATGAEVADTTETGTGVGEHGGAPTGTAGSPAAGTAADGDGVAADQAASEGTSTTSIGLVLILLTVGAASAGVVLLVARRLRRP